MLSAPTSTDLLLLAYETRCPPVTTPQGGCASAGIASRWPASQPVPLLLTSASVSGLSVRIGGLNASTFQQVDRNNWLAREVSAMAAESLVMHADVTDVVALCDQAEVLAKAAQMLGQRDAVIVSGEANIWPRPMSFRGKNAHHSYPGAGQLLRYANVRAVWLATESSHTRPH